jgi:hypothetical protein
MGFFDSLFGKNKEVREETLAQKKTERPTPPLEAIIGVNCKDIPTSEFSFYEEKGKDGWVSKIYELDYDSKIVDLFNHIKVIDFGILDGKMSKNIILSGTCDGAFIKNLNYMISDLVNKYGLDKYGKGHLTSAEKNELRDNFGDEDVSRWWEKPEESVGSIMINVYPDDNEISLVIHYQEKGWIEEYKRLGYK